MSVKAYRRNRWQPKAGHKLTDGVPYPTLADGCMVAPGMRVVHTGDGARGRLQWVRWCDPDGVDYGQRARATTTGKLKPGAWWATVSWDGEPRPHHARISVSLLVPEEPGFRDGPEWDSHDVTPDVTVDVTPDVT